VRENKEKYAEEQLFGIFDSEESEMLPASAERPNQDKDE
jgi:hypothetical protein